MMLSTLNEAILKTLVCLGLDEQMRHEFLDSVQKYDDEGRKKILEVLLREVERVKKIKKGMLIRFQKLEKEKNQILETESSKNELDALESEINSL